jgi:glycosyltransferase involved in cell wall biosynthesis
MSLTILQIAYPLAPVSRDAVGGAEQIVSMLDRAVVVAGHRSLVVACGGSVVDGTLYSNGIVLNQALDDNLRRRAQNAHRRAIVAALQRWPVDLIHMHGIDFDAYLPESETPVLVTLHLPLSWYATEALSARGRPIYFHCVSGSQQSRRPAGTILLPPIENGVPTAQVVRRRRQDSFALALGRLCPEKGFHLASEACRRAEVDLIVAGRTFNYPAHQQYFRQVLEPTLSERRRYIGPVDYYEKQQLLAAARCLLVPSLAPETSSLVAMEALACGTPVIAFADGALKEIVEHERTGFLVNDADGMASAIKMVDAIDPEECRAVARERFSAARMTSQYLNRYHELVEESRPAADRYQRLGGIYESRL